MMTDGERDLAVRALRAGDVVAFPTETVYGLGADARNPDAVSKVFALKGRPANNPLIVHVADIEMARTVVRAWTPQAMELAERHWPGPLTLVLERAEGIPDVVTGGGSTVAVRCPDHAVALELLRAFDGPLVAPSANLSGTISPTTAAHVRSIFEDVLVLDGGPCRAGIESTVVSLLDDPPLVLRLGALSLDQFGIHTNTAARTPSGPLPSPGMLDRHYAPRTPMSLFDGEAWPGVLAAYPGAIVLTHRADRPGVHEHLPGDDVGYARRLYAALHEADAMDAPHILIERPTEPGGLWDAIRDRLRRASTDR
jgi:L-threonylcarbamoyladenylate synthase